MKNIKTSEEIVICLECGKQFKQITHKHLNRHNLSTRGYAKKHNISYVSLFSRGTRELRQKIASDMQKEHNFKPPTNNKEGRNNINIIVMRNIGKQNGINAWKNIPPKERSKILSARFKNKIQEGG